MSTSSQGQHLVDVKQCGEPRTQLTRICAAEHVVPDAYCLQSHHLLVGLLVNIELPCYRSKLRAHLYHKVIKNTIMFIKLLNPESNT